MTVLNNLAALFLVLLDDRTWEYIDFCSAVQLEKPPWEHSDSHSNPEPHTRGCHELVRKWIQKVRRVSVASQAAMYNGTSAKDSVPRNAVKAFVKALWTSREFGAQLATVMLRHNVDSKSLLRDFPEVLSVGGL